MEAVFGNKQKKKNPTGGNRKRLIAWSFICLGNFPVDRVNTLDSRPRFSFFNIMSNFPPRERWNRTRKSEHPWGARGRFVRIDVCCIWRYRFRRVLPERRFPFDDRSSNVLLDPFHSATAAPTASGFNALANSFLRRRVKRSFKYRRFSIYLPSQVSCTPLSTPSKAFGSNSPLADGLRYCAVVVTRCNRVRAADRARCCS